MRQNALIGVYILELVKKYASADYKITQEQLQYYLERDYSISITRKTLSGYISELREADYIVGERGIYGRRYFSDSELRLLIDGVLFGQHVPKENAYVLIKKLKDLSSVSMKNRIKHIYYLEGIRHTDNSSLYSILDSIDSAIEKRKQIEITQCSYNIKGELMDRHKSIVSPYYIVASRSMYYLICYAGRFDDVENRRIDRISSVKILSDKAVDLKDIGNYKQCPFNLAGYMKEHIYMFSGSSEWITMRVEKNAIGEVIDWYGKEYQVINENEESVTIRMYANCNAAYYWALQYGAKVEVLKPLTLRNRIKDGLMNMIQKYGEG